MVSVRTFLFKQWNHEEKDIINYLSNILPHLSPLQCHPSLTFSVPNMGVLSPIIFCFTTNFELFYSCASLLLFFFPFSWFFFLPFQLFSVHTCKKQSWGFCFWSPACKKANLFWFSFRFPLFASPCRVRLHSWTTVWTWNVIFLPGI